MALKVIGAGVGRTGTLSLKLALERIGFGPCYHMLEVFGAARRNLPLWNEVVRGNPDWDTIFQGFSSTVDWPTCTWWRELADKYPDAKVVLSTRDPESWFASVNQTILSPENVAGFAAGPMAEFMHGAIHGAFGDRVADREFMVDWYKRREAEVIASLPPERLLVHRSRDGWEPLCKFLGVPVPAEPYPQVNSKEDMQTARSAFDLPNGPEGIEQFAAGYMGRMKAKAFDS